jgi:hypothetical protein
MMNGTQLYELAQIREQEYMLEATVRRTGRRNARAHASSLVIGAARRLRRHSHPNEG